MKSMKDINFNIKTRKNYIGHLESKLESLENAPLNELSESEIKEINFNKSYYRYTIKREMVALEILNWVLS